MAIIIPFPTPHDRLFQQMADNLRNIMKESPNYNKEDEEDAVNALSMAFESISPKSASLQTYLSTEGWPDLPQAQQQHIMDDVNRQLSEQLPGQLTEVYGTFLGALVRANLELIAARKSSQ